MNESRDLHSSDAHPFLSGRLIASKSCQPFQRDFSVVRAIEQHAPLLRCTWSARMQIR
jgi:hypothetical protein